MIAASPTLISCGRYLGTESVSASVEGSDLSDVATVRKLKESNARREFAASIAYSLTLALNNFSPHFFTARIIVEVRLLHRYPNPKVSGLGELAA